MSTSGMPDCDDDDDDDEFDCECRTEVIRVSLLMSALAWFVTIFALTMLCGCARNADDLEADAEHSLARLRPLVREAETLEKQIVIEAAANAAKSQQHLDAIRALRTKFALLEGPSPTPAPTPAPSPPTPEPIPPSPDPIPPTPPKPTLLPDGKFAIGNDVRDWVQTLVPADSRSAGREHFVRASKAIAAECQAGKITGSNRITLVLAIKEAIAKQNASIPADVLVGWRAFAAAFNKRANELFNAGRLTVPADWKTLLDEVVIGLEATP